MASSMARPLGRLPVGPLLLIGLGVLLLLSNLGIIGWDVWRTVLTLWPLALVLLGLQALVSGRVDWGSLVALLFALAAMSIAAHFVMPGRPEHTPVGPTSQAFRQGLEGATRASVRVTYGGGRLAVGSTDEAGLLASGETSSPAWSRLSTRYRVRDGTGTLEVGPRGDERRGHFDLFGNEAPAQLNLSLTRNVPLDLVVETGAAEAILDLRDLSVAALRYNTGAASSYLVLPAQGVTRADVQAGAASLTIEIPPDVAARIRSDRSGLSRVSVDETRFRRTDDGYESADYAGAANRVDLTLSVGVSSVQIR